MKCVACRSTEATEDAYFWGLTVPIMCAACMTYARLQVKPSGQAYDLTDPDERKEFVQDRDAWEDNDGDGASA